MDWTFAPPAKKTLQARVIEAAEAGLQYDLEVTPIKVLCWLQLLYEGAVDDWRHGRIATLDERMQGGQEKVAKVFRILRDWATTRNLKPFTVTYARAGRDGEQ